jgi:UDP-N-acetyl-D-mannosaminuronic acid dehydrogenase
MRVAVVGGCGHVGLPLGLVLARAGHDVTAYDIAAPTVERVNAGDMPFREPGAEPLLREVLASGRFRATTEAASIAGADCLVVVIGTPVDEHLNPDPNAVVRALDHCIPHLADTRLIVLRSTLYPGVTARVESSLRDRGVTAAVTFCPERIAEGHALEELSSLPQIVGARTDEAYAAAEELFATIGAESLRVTPEEAELAKLFTNTWRYIKFAAANQFYVMANNAGLDFERVRHAITYDYPRAADLPGAGFAAGPCLLKDTMQLAAFTNNSFVLGHSAMLVNEGLPLYLVDRADEVYGLDGKVVGILGMAFKAGSDDTRSSLAYKLRRILAFRCREVLCTDPYVRDDDRLLPLDDVLERADLLVIAAPHAEYRDLRTTVPVIDVWNALGRGVSL